jgi:hypothetical protein
LDNFITDGVKRLLEVSDISNLATTKNNTLKGIASFESHVPIIT